MGFLDTLSNIGSGAASVGSVAGALHGVVGLLSGNNSSAKSKDLMKYQASLNEQAAQRSYMRQRQLTADQYSLTKLGMRQAGMNTAQGDGSVSAASVSPENSVSPTVLPTDSSIDSQYQQMMSNSASLISNLGLQRAQVALLQSQKTNQDIKNINQLAKDQSEIENLKENTNKTMLEAAHQSLVNKYADSRLSAENEEANARALMAQQDQAVHGQMLEVDYNKKIADLYLANAQGRLTDQQLKTEVEKLNVMRSQVAANYASASDSLSHVGVNRTTTRLNTANAHFIEKGMDDNLAILKSERVRKWYDALPQNVQQIILSSGAVRSAVGKLQNGGDLDSSDWTALGAALGYEKAGALVEVIKNAIGTRKVPTVKRVSPK